MKTLRPYQDTAYRNTLAAWGRGIPRVLLVLPTGAGKTVVFARLAEAMRQYGRIVVLAHREELLDQAEEKISAWTALRTTIEQGDRYGDPTADVLIASVASLRSERRRLRFDPAHYGLMIVDEAHHAVADTYKTALQYFGPRFLLGVTATPDRLDRKSLRGTFDEVAFTYELREAIKDGWLARIVLKKAVIKDLDLSQVRTTAGDLNEGELEAQLLKETVRMEMARAIADHVARRKTLVFATTINHAEALAEAIREFMPEPGRVNHVSGRDSADARATKISLFRKGLTQVLVNCMIATEGFDEPAIECVALGRPTESRALASQMIGRGSRLYCPRGCVAACGHPEAKTSVLILDFAGNAGKHRLVNPVDILGGAEDERIREIVARAESNGQALDVMEAIDQAHLELAAQARAKARLDFIEVDPFATISGILRVSPAAGRWGGIEATDAQLDTLERAGLGRDIDLDKVDRGQASALIEAIIERRKAGLCTYKMAKVLARAGHDPDMDYEPARALIDELAKTWRR
jgi:superfamily II DNA or RNA helicase